MIWRVNTDIAAGLLGLAFAGIFWLSRGRLTTLSAIFPETILILTTLISAILLVKGALRGEQRVVFDEGDRIRLVVTSLILFAWWWLIGVLGFFVASVLVFLVLVWYLAIAQRQVRLPEIALWLGIIVAEVAFFYLVFSRLLYIRPPRGMFF